MKCASYWYCVAKHDFDMDACKLPDRCECKKFASVQENDADEFISAAFSLIAAAPSKTMEIMRSLKVGKNDHDERKGRISKILKRGNRLASAATFAAREEDEYQAPRSYLLFSEEDEFSVSSALRLVKNGVAWAKRTRQSEEEEDLFKLSKALKTVKKGISIAKTVGVLEEEDNIKISKAVKAAKKGLSIAQSIGFFDEEDFLKISKALKNVKKGLSIAKTIGFLEEEEDMRNDVLVFPGGLQEAKSVNNQPGKY